MCDENGTGISQRRVAPFWWFYVWQCPSKTFFSSIFMKGYSAWKFPGSKSWKKSISWVQSWEDDLKLFLLQLPWIYLHILFDYTATSVPLRRKSFAQSSSVCALDIASLPPTSLPSSGGLFSPNMRRYAKNIFSHWGTENRMCKILIMILFVQQVEYFKYKIIKLWNPQ